MLAGKIAWLAVWMGLLMASTAVAQPTPCTTTGTLRDPTIRPLEGIAVTAETRDNTALAYGFSDAAGAFSIRLASALDSVRVRARSMSYLERSQLVRNAPQRLDWTLTPGEVQLKEVTVQSAPITRQGDTLSYKVDAFAGKQDRVISDVLKKMPGIEVAADGQISYEGRPINKFYINGQDLLEGRYALASDNLPADAVQSVQVLERHQPIRALDKLVHPDNAALNLKLKRKVTATGQARLGAGLVPAPLAGVWNANVSPMLFTKKQQLLDTYQGNNTGQDVAAELKPLTLADLPQRGESSPRKPDLTHVQGLGQPPVATSRYLFNQVHLLSANHLVTLNKENQVRVNASYLHDVQTQRGSTQTTYYLPDIPAVKLSEIKYNQLYFNSLQTDLAFIKNVANYYLKNTLSLDGRWDAQTGDLYRPESQTRIAQTATNPYVSLSNRLGLVRPVGAGCVVQASSLVFYTSSPQQLAVSPGPFTGLLAGGAPYDTARQQARQGSFFTSNSLGLTISRGAWAYAGTAGFSEEVQRLTSALETGSGRATGLPVRNDLRWARGRYYLQPAVSCKTETWATSLEAPVTYLDFRVTDAPLEANQRLQTVVAEPHLSVRHDLGPLWYASAGAGLSNGFGEIGQLHYAYLLRDYRALQRNDALLPRSRGQSYNAGLFFKNPLKSLFFQATYAFSTTTSNRLYSSRLLPDGALTTVALDQDNRSASHTVAGSVSQFISPWKTNLSLQVRAHVSQQPQVLNDVLAQTETRSLGSSFRASVSAFDWGSLEYSAALTALRSRVADAPAPPLALLHDHHAAVSVFPHGGHQVSLAADYYASQGPGPTVQAFFADLTYRYALPTARKIDLEVSWSNIFDARQYQYSYVSQFMLAQTTYQLRPAQVLASVRMSL